MDTHGLERILDGFKAAEDEYSSAQAEQKWCDERTQDLLHDLELNHHSYHERGKIATELVTIRQRRRIAKDKIELLLPLCAWMTNNTKSINQLKGVLGDMRKIDVKIKNRLYWPKHKEERNEG